ncbi:hypothetical protein BH24ACT15_BH24ACT15_32170 [soil metagenome]
MLIPTVRLVLTVALIYAAVWLERKWAMMVVLVFLTLASEVGAYVYHRLNVAMSTLNAAVLTLLSEAMTRGGEGSTDDG